MNLLSYILCYFMLPYRVKAIIIIIGKQIVLPLRGCPILLSLVTELDSTQSYYHYLQLLIIYCSHVHIT